MFENLLIPSGIEDEIEFMSPIITMDDEQDELPNKDIPETLPLIALKNTVLFPGIIIPITISREKSTAAIKSAYENSKIIGVVSQREIETERPTAEDLFEIGTVAKIVKLINMQDGTTTAILQGKKRFRLNELVSDNPFLLAQITLVEDLEPLNNNKYIALIESIKDLSQQIVKLSPNIPPEAALMLKNIDSNKFLMNFVASHLNLKIKPKQAILETDDMIEKAEKILQYIDGELNILQLRNQIESKVRTDLEKQQRDYFLNQQLKTIQEELGQNTHTQDQDSLKARAKKKKWSKTVKETFEKELKRVARMNPAVAEYSVTMNYLELLLDLPWNQYTKDNFDLKKASQILEKDHHGLDKVKERILEHLAVLKLKGDMKAPILCLVGPPGVGKTSLGKSIASALKRKYIRMSLGGLHDESEVRGHRKTYIGAMPGRIIQSLKKVKSSNPVFILDEIDKVGKSFRGDPSSALLEVLDPEQNGTFHDNYLELEYDLSKVLFIATANSLNSIQPALLDRMEIIRVSGYSQEEKVEIAQKHLIPDQLKEHGLKSSQIKLKPEVIAKIVQEYTRESGVRELNRRIGGVMRGVAKRVAMEEKYNKTIKPGDLHGYLGPLLYTRDLYQEIDTPGVAVGLAWTSAGGDILFIEASLSKGKGTLTLTGNLGDVMKESASTALSFLKANCDLVGLKPKDFDDKNIHIHVPEGAIPKDGPSAGITMLSALASAFTGRKVKSYLAMTGEITLRGKVLPVGGIKEKILAANRAGIKHIVMCKTNEKDVKEIDSSYISDLNFTYIETMADLLQKVLV